METHLAVRSDAEHYDSERRREQAEVREIPAAETRGVTDVLGCYGGQCEPRPRRAKRSKNGATRGGSLGSCIARN